MINPECNSSKKRKFKIFYINSRNIFDELHALIPNTISDKTNLKENICFSNRRLKMNKKKK